MGRRKVYTEEQDLQIVRLFAEGKNVKEISVILSINRRTLENRIVAMRKQAQARTIGHLIAKLLSSGALSPVT